VDFDALHVDTHVHDSDIGVRCENEPNAVSEVRGHLLKRRTVLDDHVEVCCDAITVRRDANAGGDSVVGAGRRQADVLF